MWTTLRILVRTPGPAGMMEPGDVVRVPSWLAGRLVARGVAIAHAVDPSGVGHALDVDAAPPPGTDWSQALVSALDGIGPATAQKLADAGIETVGQLMAADPARVAAAAGVSAARVEKWRQRGALLTG